MQKSYILALVVLAFGAVAQGQEIAWVMRPPTAGVKVGEIARIELVAVNAHEKTLPLTAPSVLTGTLGDADSKTNVELKLIGTPQKSVPVGGFVILAYDLTIPEGTGDRVLRVTSPYEATAVIKVLAAEKKPLVTSTTPTTPTTTVVVTPTPLTLTPPADRLPTTSDSGTVEFVKNKLSPHERMYFLIGNESPSAKFQISFKYQVFNENSNLAADHPWLNGFYLGYTQTSFWDITADSAPFFDSTYRPEIFWATNDIRIAKFPSVARFDFQTGFQHESNGKGGDDSRTVNAFYLQPVFTLGDKDALFFTFAPKAYVYISSLADNPDITDYRGYFDLKFIVGQGDGLQAAITGRIGDDWDKGSVQLDVSYPLRKIIFNALDVYLHAQVYNGYGESLLRYNQEDTTFRVGISLVR